MVELVARHVVAHQVAAVVREPEAAVERAPVEAHRVADAARDRLESAAVGVHALQDAVARIGQADVARRAGRHVQLAVGAEGEELRAMVRLARQLVGDDHGLRRIAEVRVDGIEAQDARDRRDVERAVAPRDAGRQLQPRCDDVHPTGAAAVELHRVDLARAHAADVEHALAALHAAERQGTRVRHRVGQQLDAKTGAARAAGRAARSRRARCRRSTRRGAAQGMPERARGVDPPCAELTTRRRPARIASVHRGLEKRAPLP